MFKPSFIRQIESHFRMCGPKLQTRFAADAPDPDTRAGKFVGADDEQFVIFAVAYRVLDVRFFVPDS